MNNFITTMKTYLLTACSIIFCWVNSIAQIPEIAWENTIGGSANETFFSSKPTIDGGFIIGGMSVSPISGDKTEGKVGAIFYDYWIVKVDSNGVVEWDNTIGGNNNDYLMSIDATSDGGFILLGDSWSGATGDKTSPANGDSDCWLIKLDSVGNILWQKSFGGSGTETARGIHQIADGGFILAMSSNSGISGNKTEACLGGFDFWIIKLDDDGNVVWQNTIGGASDDKVYSIIELSGGGFMAGGSSASGIGGDKSESCLGESDFWVVKLNTSGGLIWQKTIGGSDFETIYEIIQNPDGSFLLAGNSGSGISGNKTEINFGILDYWLVKMGPSGALLWQHTIGGSDIDMFYRESVKRTLDGGYILGGYSKSEISGNKTVEPIGNEDFWLVKVNGLGEIEWQKTIGGSMSDYLYSTHQLKDGSYFLAGYSSSNATGDKSENNIGGGADYWIVKLTGACKPTTEICNSIDDNCDGNIDEDLEVTVTISPSGATTFCQGSNVSLIATHNGDAVQWKKNGVNIVGATSASLLVNATGNYTCMAYSDCDTNTSSIITVTVNKNPKAIISAGGPTEFCAGGSVSLTETPSVGCSYQWYKGASPIAGATTTTYVATTAGNYKCRVTKTATGCFKNSNGIVVTITCKESENENIAPTISIYPNPTSGHLNINTDIMITAIKIFNNSGAVVQQITNWQGESIDVSLLASGVYYLQLFSATTTMQKIFVKE